MSLTEKVAYIRGLIDGKSIDTTTSEGKILDLLVDLLDDIAHDVASLEEESENLNGYIEEIDEDLGYLEDVVYGDVDDDCTSDDCFGDFECDCNCEDCECDLDCDECEKGGDYDFFEVVCPTCNSQVYLDNSIDPTQVRCPSCHNEFSVIDNN